MGAPRPRWRLPKCAEIIQFFQDRPENTDDYIEAPEGSGLGVELDEDEARKYVTRGDSFFA